MTDAFLLGSNTHGAAATGAGGAEVAPRLVTERLVLRPPAPRDWPAYRDFALSGGMHHISPGITAGRAWRDFAAELGHWQMRGFGLWAVTRRGEDRAIGMIGPFYPVDWPEPEIGWMIFADAEGQGYAFEAAVAARADAFARLGWTTAVSYIAQANARSIRLAERLGAWGDDTAPRPSPDVLVYRHPAPEVVR